MSDGTKRVLDSTFEREVLRSAEIRVEKHDNY